MSAGRGDARPHGAGAWAVAPALAVLAAALHVAMEWLFLVTKSSFLSAAGRGEGLLAALAAVAPAAVLAAVTAAALAGAAALGRGEARWRALALLPAAAPAAALALTTVVLLDNFAHTVFSFGITTPHGPVRHLAAVLLVAVFLAWLRQVRRWERALAARPGARRAVVNAAAAVFAAAALAALAARGVGAVATPAAAAAAVTAATAAVTERGPGPQGPRGRRRPNVVLIGLDGVEAKHLSLYGYRRPTSPNLERLAREALVFDNAFPNAGTTAGSLVSLLSGRPPLDNGVVARPDALAGEAARMHLPGILKHLGYRTGIVSVREWADPVDLNLRGGFDWANGRRLDAGAVPGAGSEELADLQATTAAFRAAMRERLAERLHRAFSPRLRPTAFEEVTRSMARPDDRRLLELFGFIAEGGEPFFAHVHLMQPHGPFFAVRRGERVFARGRVQSGPWQDDFYDDAIRFADVAAGTAVDFLRRRGLLDRTVVVVYSDHGRRHVAAVRVPLLVRLPGGSPAGRIAIPVENLDVAPTVLDAIGAPAPRWMRGRSLLRRDLDACRWIASASMRSGTESDPGPPPAAGSGPTLAQLGLVTGLRTFELETATGAVTEGRLPPPPSGGPACPEATAEEARRYLLGLLGGGG